MCVLANLGEKAANYFNVEFWRSLLVFAIGIPTGLFLDRLKKKSDNKEKIKLTLKNKEDYLIIAISTCDDIKSTLDKIESEVAQRFISSNVDLNCFEDNAVNKIQFMDFSTTRQIELIRYEAKNLNTKINFFQQVYFDGSMRNLYGGDVFNREISRLSGLIEEHIHKLLPMLERCKPMLNILLVKVREELK